MVDGRDAMLDMLDRHGGDLRAWPAPERAGDARRRALADRGFRAELDAAIALDTGLARLREELDVAIAATGAPDRVARAVMAALPARSAGRRRWAWAAAAVVVAAALGALADIAVLTPPGSESFEVVVLDPLLFDPAGTLRP